MRIVIAAALSLLLLGCQQTSEHHSVASTPQEKYESTELFDTRAKAAIGTITDKIASKCMDGLNSIALLQEFLRSPCMKTTLLRNFDKTGEIKEKCPAEEKLGDFAECVIVGGFITEIFSSYGEQPGPEAWRDIERAKQEFGLIVYKKDGVACQQSDMSEPEMEECIFKGIADHLQILPEDEEKCSDIKDAEKRAGCLGEAAMAEYLERATEALQL